VRARLGARRSRAAPRCWAPARARRRRRAADAASDTGGRLHPDPGRADRPCPGSVGDQVSGACPPEDQQDASVPHAHRWTARACRLPEGLDEPARLQALSPDHAGQDAGARGREKKMPSGTAAARVLGLDGVAGAMDQHLHAVQPITRRTSRGLRADGLACDGFRPGECPRRVQGKRVTGHSLADRRYCEKGVDRGVGPAPPVEPSGRDLPRHVRFCPEPDQPVRIQRVIRTTGIHFFYHHNEEPDSYFWTAPAADARARGHRLAHRLRAPDGGGTPTGTRCPGWWRASRHTNGPFSRRPARESD
jgi:hypothetical protein